MTTGLISRVMGPLALASALFAPLSAARADSLEGAFDKAFAAKPAPAQTFVPSSQPRLVPVSVQPAVYTPVQRTYGSGLEAQIASLASSGMGRIGVAALDLSTGRSLAILGNQPFPMASTSKIAIVATFLDQVDSGRLSLNDRFALRLPVPSPKYSSAAAPVREGTEMAAIELIDRAIIHSDNHATDALLAAVGGPAAVNRWMRSAGLSGMRLDRDINTLVRDDGEFDPARTVDVRDSATPTAMVDLLSGIYQGRWLSRSSNQVLLSAMERCVTGKHRIRALLPEEARVLHKTGTLSNTSSDVGIINTPDGRAIAVAIYVTGQGGKANRDARIATIARAIYDGYQTDPSGYFRSASR